MSLKDKVIFMSGGSRGIGLAMAKKAAQDGAKIVVAAKTADPHPKLPGTIYTAADEIIEAGGDALPVLCDIRDEDNVRDAINKAVEHFGGIDICINNASAIQLTNVTDTEMKRYDLKSPLTRLACRTSTRLPSSCSTLGNPWYPCPRGG